MWSMGEALATAKNKSVPAQQGHGGQTGFSRGIGVVGGGNEIKDPKASSGIEGSCMSFSSSSAVRTWHASSRARSLMTMKDN